MGGGCSNWELYLDFVRLYQGSCWRDHSTGIHDMPSQGKSC